MRYIMEAMPYDAYLKRLNKQMNYDKYRNAPGSDEFRFWLSFKLFITQIPL